MTQDQPSFVRFSSVDGLSLSCRTYSGPHTHVPILLLHDLVQTSRSFEAFAEATRAVRALFVPDLRGFGRSDYPIDLAGYGLARLADDVTRLTDAAKLSHMVLLGVGYGGLVALRFAAGMPGQVAALILVECGPEPSLAALRALAQRAEAAARLPWPQAEAKLPGADGIFIDRAGRPALDWDTRAAPLLISGLARGDLWADFEALRAKPILALRAEGSTLVSTETFTAMAWRKPDLVRASLAGESDCRGLATPAARKAITAFLNSCP